MTSGSDVVILGGGVIGLTTAYYLAKEGARVTILERGDPGKEASWAGAGILPPSDPDHARTPFDRLRGLSGRLFPGLSDELRDATGTSIVLITHDLGVVAETADRVAVMYAGQIVEEAPVRELFAQPRHPYTEGLLRAVPKLGSKQAGHARLQTIEGIVPNPLELPPGCRFAPRCAYRLAQCDAKALALQLAGTNHASRCVRINELYP